MEKTIFLFRKNISRVHALVDTAEQIQATKAEVAQDILRSAIVLLVSALDTFVHDCVRTGMIQILKGERKRPTEYQKFQITMTDVSFDENYQWFERVIRERHQKLSFQNANGIANIMKFVKEQDIWTLLEKELQEGIKLAKTRLDGIVRKRNQIAHESDIDPTSFGESYYPISVEDVKEHIEFIENLVNAIYKVFNELTA